MVPSLSYLDSYCDALRRDWSPNTVRPEVAQEELATITADPETFLRQKVGLDQPGPPIRQADGTTRPRLPGFTRWLWDGEFSGSINVRWQPGTVELPPYVLGHIGYTVVPWKRGRGYATSALAQLLVELDGREDLVLPYVELSTDDDNIASQRVIEANGGQLLARFTMPDDSGGGRGLRYRIHR